MGLIAWIFEDERYGRERLWMVISGLFILLVVIGGGWFLYSQIVREAPAEPLLTADQLPPEETFAEPVPTSPLLEATRAAAAGRYGEARAMVQALLDNLDNDPDRARAFTLLANIERHEGRLDEALPLLNQAIALETTAWRVFLRGDTQRRLGQIEEAAQNFALAQELSPAQPLYSNAVLLLDVQRGRQETVASSIELRSSLGLQNTRPSWVFAAAALELANGQPNLAAISLRDGVQAMPTDHVDLLLDFEPLSRFQDEGPVMAFFIKTSTERLLPRQTNRPPTSAPSPNSAPSP